MINILFSGNDKVFDGILTCALSMFKRSDTKEPFHFYVMTMDVSHLKPEYTAISEKRISYLDKVVKTYNPENEVTRLEVSDIYKKEFANSPNEQCYCSPYTLLRLFLDLIPDMPDKILYLDVDVLFNRDIKLLYDIDVTDYEYAAARDHYGKYLLNPNYINAGVLLFNLKKVKETGLLVKARALIKEKKLMFADQDAIYKSTTAKLMLPQKYNDQKFLWDSTIIRHFSKRLFYLPYPHTENVKQWHVSRMYKVFGYNQFDDVIFEYLYWKGKYEREEN